MIRIAQKEDCNSIKELIHQLGYTSLDERQVANKIAAYQQIDYKLFVIEKDKQVAGFISLHCYEAFHSPGKVGRITALCIDEKFQGMGLGKQLLAEGEKYFIEAGCTKLEVTSNNRRTQAHDFYLAQGYIEDSRKFVKSLLKV